MYESDDPLHDVLVAYLRFTIGRKQHVPLPARYSAALQYFDEVVRRESGDFYYERSRCSRCGAELWLVPDPEKPIGASGQGLARCRVCDVPYFVVCSPDGSAELTPIRSDMVDTRESADVSHECDGGAPADRN